ncbi:MAG: tetratricopeptide repeat protein [Pyrinomonadaceae bacterium]
MKTIFGKLLPVAAFIVMFFSANQAQTKPIEKVIVLPFENISDEANFNWVGESIADSLSNLLNDPAFNLSVISNQERKIVQQKSGVPSAALPSLASSIRIARKANANLLVLGTYNITPEKNDVAASITVRARIIKVNEGTFFSEKVEGGKSINREIVITDAISELQKIQGQIAFQILYLRDNALPLSRDDFVDRANKVPARAFEAYIKGLIAPDSDKDTKIAYFTNALRIYSDEKEGELYQDAAVELGFLYMDQNDSTDALSYFARIPQNSPLFPESAFYSGLIHWRQGTYEQALSVMESLPKDYPFTFIFNTLGAISTEASRSEKNSETAANYLVEGLEYLTEAKNSSAQDSNVLFNYSLALFLKGDYAGAAKNLRVFLTKNDQDGEAYFLLSKALEKLGEANASDIDNQARKYLTANNRYANLENQWKAGNYEGLALRVNIPTRRSFVSTVLSNDSGVAPVSGSADEIGELLKRAKTLYDEGNDDAALEIGRRILVSEPTSAENYLLLGKIHLRRGDTEQAISSLKAASFWNNRLVEPHILLGKIYIQKKDCQQAKTYLDTAVSVDAENPETKALARLVERCSK